jgi:DNA-binding GntR family transcriptional regulator
MATVNPRSASKHKMSEQMNRRKIPSSTKKASTTTAARATAPAARQSLRIAPRLSSLSEQVTEELRRQIVHSHRQPGDRLVELEIAAEMGVSQGTVREALQRLESDGLVERQSRTATFVTGSSLEEMYELSMIRQAVEGFTFRRAAKRITDKQCDELQSLVEQMREAARNKDMETLERIDTEFHQRVCELSGSRILLRVWLPLFTQLRRFITQAHQRFFPQRTEIADGHQPLVDALRSRDPKKAETAVTRHILVSWARMNEDQQLEKPKVSVRKKASR